MIFRQFVLFFISFFFAFRTPTYGRLLPPAGQILDGSQVLASVPRPLKEAIPTDPSSAPQPEPGLGDEVLRQPELHRPPGGGRPAPAATHATGAAGAGRRCQGGPRGCVPLR